MSIKIYDKGKCSKEEKECIRNAIKFYANRLNINIDNILINVIINNYIKLDGYMEEILPHEEYDIVVKNNANTLLIIAHEMVHIEQHIHNRIFESYKDPNIIEFDGIIYRTSELDYHEEPWEIEAYKLERILYNEFLKETNR